VLIFLITETPLRATNTPLDEPTMVLDSDAIDAEIGEAALVRAR